MAQKLILVVAACLAIASGALVRRDAGAGAGRDALQDWQRHAAEFQKTFSEGLNSAANSKNTQELNKALKEGSDSVLQQLSVFSASLRTAIADANGKAKEALEQARASVERSVAELRQAHPEVEQQATALKDKLTQAVQNTVQQSEKVAKTVSASLEETNKKLAPQLRQAYDEFVKQAQDVQQKIHAAAAEQQ